MSKTKQITIRMSEAEHARLVAVIPALESLYPGVPIGKATAARILIERGVAQFHASERRGHKLAT